MGLLNLSALVENRWHTQFRYGSLPAMPAGDNFFFTAPLNLPRKTLDGWTSAPSSTTCTNTTTSYVNGWVYPANSGPPFQVYDPIHQYPRREDYLNREFPIGFNPYTQRWVPSPGAAYHWNPYIYEWEQDYPARSKESDETARKARQEFRDSLAKLKATMSGYITDNDLKKEDAVAEVSTGTYSGPAPMRVTVWIREALGVNGTQLSPAKFIKSDIVMARNERQAITLAARWPEVAAITDTEVENIEYRVTLG